MLPNGEYQVYILRNEEFQIHGFVITKEAHLKTELAHTTRSILNVTMTRLQWKI